MSGRPWVKHDGTWPRPSECKIGVTATVLYRDGGTRTSTFKKPPTATPPRMSRWLWTGEADDIIAYRLSDTDDKAKREARMAEFTRIADEGLKTDVPVKTPQKVGADQ